MGMLETSPFKEARRDISTGTGKCKTQRGWGGRPPGPMFLASSVTGHLGRDHLYVPERVSILQESSSLQLYIVYLDLLSSTSLHYMPPVGHPVPR